METEDILHTYPQDAKSMDEAIEIASYWLNKSWIQEAELRALRKILRNHGIHPTCEDLHDAMNNLSAR